MFWMFHNSRLTRLIGMVAAYAFVLQATLAYGMAAHAAAQADTGSSGAFFVICSSHGDQTAPDDGNAPATSDAHCPDCTLSIAASALVPDVAALPIHRLGAGRTAFVTTAACLSFHRARAGLSRAPPQNT